MLGRWLPVLLWMCVIFSASGDAMSFGHSSRIIGRLARWLLPQLSDATLHDIVVFVRKCAHVSEYALLALLLWAALPRARHQGGWDWAKARQVLTLLAIYAASDEFHQAFVPSRQGSVWDVLLDTFGGMLGLAVLWGVIRCRRRRCETEVLVESSGCQTNP